MRRTLILILLGIICYSTMTSIFPGVQKQNPKMILDTVYGAVSAGNFTYWTYGQKGPLIIELHTSTGDADLFISDNQRPSYEADRNNFSSETCGTDVVYIPDEFPRPLGIGVYGQWSHTLSEFSLKVYLNMVAMEALNQGIAGIMTPDDLPSGSSSAGAGSHSAKEADMDNVEELATKEQEKSQFLKYFKFIRVLDTMFDLFVL